MSKGLLINQPTSYLITTIKPGEYRDFEIEKASSVAACVFRLNRRGGNYASRRLALEGVVRVYNLKKESDD